MMYNYAQDARARARSTGTHAHALTYAHANTVSAVQSLTSMLVSVVQMTEQHKDFAINHFY